MQKKCIREVSPTRPPRPTVRWVTEGVKWGWARVGWGEARRVAEWLPREPLSQSVNLFRMSPPQSF